MQTRIYVTKTKKKRKVVLLFFLLKNINKHRHTERKTRKVLNTKGSVSTYQRTTHMINLCWIYKSI